MRNQKSRCISCDIYIMEEYPDIADTLDLTVPDGLDQGMATRDFLLTDGEIWKWKQYLLAKGCDQRLMDNPYLETMSDDNEKKR